MCDQGEFELSGRRIIDIHHFIQQLQLLNQHCPLGCSISDMKVISECRRGLNSGIKFKCLMCNVEKVIWTNDNSSKHVSLNTSAVLGTIGIGIGFSNMEEFFSAMNIPSMSTNTYAIEHNKVSTAWEKCALDEMKQANEIEKSLAIQKGDVDSEGVPLLTVIVDGTWAKRSYRNNYSSLSGCVSIYPYNFVVGYHIYFIVFHCCIAFAMSILQKII